MSQLSDIKALVIISFSIFGIVEICVAIFFFIAGIKVLSILNKIQQKQRKMSFLQYLNPNNSSRVQLMSIRIMISGLGMIITGICSFLASSTLFDQPINYVLILFFMMLGMLITSLTHVLAFVPGNKTFNDSDSTSEKDSKYKETTITSHEEKVNSVPSIVNSQELPPNQIQEIPCKV